MQCAFMQCAFMPCAFICSVCARLGSGCLGTKQREHALGACGWADLRSNRVTHTCMEAITWRHTHTKTVTSRTPNTRARRPRGTSSRSRPWSGALCALPHSHQSPSHASTLLPRNLRRAHHTGMLRRFSSAPRCLRACLVAGRHDLNPLVRAVLPWPASSWPRAFLATGSLLRTTAWQPQGRA